MSADQWVLVALLVAHFLGLVLAIVLDPAHRLDAWRASR